jgi:hypothetical protein
MLRLILNRNFRSERPARALYTSFALLRKEAAAAAAIPQSMPGRQRMCLKTCVIGRFRNSK